MKASASILVWKGNAYLPTLAPYEHGGHIDVDPVIITTPDMENLIPAIEKSLERNSNQKTIQADYDVSSKSPMLNATKARSWYKLADTGASYAIDWTDDLITVYMTLPGKKNKFMFDRDKTQEFPPDTSIKDILTVILNDIHSRPEALTP